MCGFLIIQKDSIIALMRLDFLSALDHIGPEICQGFGGKGAGDQLAQFKDFETGQWAGAG
jgi:hypothetical protein